jgi:hypothetical protein
MLVRRGAAAWLNAVYLFHPVFWTFSGTLLSDVPTAVAFLVAMDAWEEGRPGAAGTAVAFACFARLSSAFAALGFMLAMLKWDRRSIRSVAVVAACSAAGGGALLAWNRLVYGAAVATDYAVGNQSLLSGAMVLDNVLLYGLGLLLVPPFAAACLVVRPRRADRWALMAIPILAFFVAYAYHDSSANPLMRLVGGQRLVVAAHAALLVATARTWSEMAVFRRRWVVGLAGVCTALAASLVLRRIEAPHREAAEAAARCSPAKLAYNMNAVRAAAAIDAGSYHLLDGRDRVPAADLVILSRRSLSQHPGARQLRYTGPEPKSDRCVQVGEYRIFDLSGRCSLEGDPCEPAR